MATTNILEKILDLLNSDTLTMGDLGEVARVCREHKAEMRASYAEQRAEAKATLAALRVRAPRTASAQGFAPKAKPKGKSKGKGKPKGKKQRKPVAQVDEQIES